MYRSPNPLPVEQSLLNSCVENAFFGFAVLDRDLRYRYVNDTLAAMNGIPASDHIGMRLQDVVPDMVDTIRPLCAEVIEKGEPIRCVEVSGETPAAPGQIRYWVADYSPVRQGTGKLLGVCASVIEITQLKEMQKALAASEERYRLIAEATNDVLWDWDAVSNRIWWNQGLQQILGYSARNNGYDEWLNMIHPDDRQRVSSGVEECLRNGSHNHQLEYRLKRANGTYAHFADRFAVVRNDRGDPIRLMGAMMDITDRKKLESERETLSMAVEQATESIIITDPDGAITYVNPSFETTTGYRREEVLGKNPRFLKSDQHKGEFYDQLWKKLKNGLVWSGCITNKRKDGSLIQEETIISPVRDKTGRVLHYVAVKRDLTERNRAEAETHRLNAEVATRKQQIESIVKSVPGLVWEAWGKPDAATQRMGYVSDYVQTLVGYTVEEWLKTPNFWLSIVDPEDKDRVAAEAAEHFIRGEGHQTEFRWVHKDGRRVWVECRTSIITDSDGRPAGVRGVTIDITGRKALEAQLRQAQKMEAVGALAGGIAHDFNNLLTVINGYSDMVLGELNPDDPSRQKLEQIKSAGSRAAALTRQLLIFSRKQVLRASVVDLNALVLDVEKMLRRLIGENIELVTAYRCKVGPIWADRSHIEQVVMNLSVNARDAMANGGKLTIETENIIVDDATAGKPAESRPGPYVLLTVTDNGVGMNLATQARIFEPFFTTKDPGKGTGLGLSTVYGIVRQWDGFIFVRSQPGQGTTFKIYFPFANEKIKPVSVDASASAPHHGTETILLAEDDDMVRLLTRSILEKCGYNVLEARNADEALSLALQHTSPIHLLLTDVIMPKGTGIELAHRVMRIWPEAGILYMSGYTDNALPRQELLGYRAFFIQKPFDANTLARQVKEALSRSL